jgi:apolipoprotein N-acyltransferase
MAVIHMRGALMSFIYGLAAGTLSYLGIIYWIFPTVQVGTGDLNIAGAAVFSLSLALSLQFGLFALACHYLKRVKWLFPLAGAAAWVSFEFLHQIIAYKFTAFPWFVLGYTQFSNIELIQISSYTGVYGVSFLIVLFGLGIAVAVTKKAKPVTRVIYLILPLITTAIVFMAGRNIVQSQNAFLDSNTQKISVALMQTNTHELLLAGFEEDVAYTLYEQAQALENKKVEFIIWPESSFPGLFQKGEYFEFMQYVHKLTNAAQITGGVYEEGGAEYVSAGFFDERELKDIYRKNKLVPFGEFLPRASFLNGLYEKYGITSLTGTFVEGKEPGKIFDLILKGTQGGKQYYKFGVEICFESLFPRIWREQSKSGAQFFVNISNDGWFLDTAAAYQHLRATIFRAVENRRPVLRAANTGISAWISALGEIKFKTELNKAESALFSFSFQPRAGKTFYSENGDVFSIACAVIFLTALIFSLVFLNTSKNDRA